MNTRFTSLPLIGAALASVLVCYTVSLKVSAERAAVATARAKIRVDLADIRLLEAELHTRARLPELQRWNEQVLALAPPKAEQFLGSAVQLAAYATTGPRAAPATPALRTPPLRDAIARAPSEAAMAAPSPVRQIAYRAVVTPRPDPAPLPAATIPRATVVAVPPALAPVRLATSRPTRPAAGFANAGLDRDTDFAGAIAAAAEHERAGFEKIALR